MEKECERIDGNICKQSSAAILNTRHPIIKTNLDASCNVLYVVFHFYFWELHALCVIQVCRYGCKTLDLLSCFQC